MRRRWITTLAATFAAFAASAGTAIAGTPVPVQSATQSSTTDQAALAASSATQVDPTNQNISVRVLSPGNDGAVSQSNEAESSATAANTGTTTQNATQAQSPGCGCAATTGLTSGNLDDVLAGAMQAAGTDAAAPATAAPAPSTGSSTQSNEASSSGTAANSAPTTQAATQSGTGTGGVQSSQQDATTDQTAQAASSATQIAPSNSNISVRVLSPGNDGAVSQSNEASSTADATNSAPTTQGSSQTGAGSGVQSSTQNADTSQKSVALSSATQVQPENSNLSVRVLSPGNGGSVSQSNEAESSANAQNTAPVTQTARQTELGPTCGCSSTSPAVQAIGQSSSVWQDAAAASSATQLGASNVSDPVRIASGGNDGALTQENEAESSASAKNTAPVTQWGSQQQAASPCGCTTGPAVQALGQSSWIGQQAKALSSAWQIGATNESGPVRIASYGNGGPVSQSNEAESSASASNTALPYQVGSQMQGGNGVQALGQHSSIWQGALAESAAFQLPGRSTCGCGSSFGNSAGPIRIGSAGNDGALTQENEVSSSADASNWAAPTQIGTQTQFLPPCGCSGLRVQALGQESLIHQIAAALSSATQIGASNTSDPVRIWSPNDSGNTRRLKEE